MLIPLLWHPWVVLACTAAIFATLMISRRIPLDLLFLTGLIVVTLGGVISPQQAFSGFSNPAVLTIGALLGLTAALRKCGLIDWLGTKLLGDVRSETQALRRLGGALVAASPFLLNTALVSMFVPLVLDWCHKHKVSPSKLLIPVSYFSILGGVCTLIGTSTTLVVQAQLNALSLTNPSVEPLGFFELGLVGFPCALVGLGFLVLMGPRLLPQRIELKERFDDNRREYLIEMVVEPGCGLIGKDIETAELRHLQGLFLIEIDRSDEVITPVSPRQTIVSGDHLLFVGVVETISDLEKIPGLVPAAELNYEQPGQRSVQRHLTEVVLSGSSPLIGQSIRQAEFRKLYGAAVLAIHRNGERVRKKIGDVVLEPGDTLLIQTRNRFADSHRNSRDFLLVRTHDGIEQRQHSKAWLVAAVVIALIAWLTIGSLLGGGETWASPPIAAFAALLVLIGTRCMRFSDVRKSLDIQLLLTIAFALGIGEAMSSSGAALKLADWCTSAVSHPLLLLAVVYLVTMVLTEMISNTAVAAIMIPIAVSVAQTAEIDSRPFIIAVTLAASLAFITPIGYQTNLMVMGPGGYRPADYMRCGLPLAILIAMVALVLIQWIYPIA